MSPGWFVSNANITTITFRDKLAAIEPNAFDDCTFRSVLHMELRGTSVAVLKNGAFAGLNKLKTLSLYGNLQMAVIEGKALEGLYQLEEFVMEEHRQFTDLKNVTGEFELNYLHSLKLSKNSFQSIIKKPTFKGCNRVKLLNLSNSEIDAIGPDSFEPMDKTLEVLDLSNNRLKHLPNRLLENMIRPNVQFYLSHNLWNCNCESTELQGYDLKNCSLIVDGPLTCETPVNGTQMRDVPLFDCFTTTTSFTPIMEQSTTKPPPNYEHFKCVDQTDSYQSTYIAVETEYQFFNIKQEGIGKVSIEINYPDASLALVFINDHDYETKCQYELKRKMFFDSLNTKAGHLFCLIKKSSYNTSPRNCLPFHFNDTSFTWDRDRVIITLVCSFALAILIGVIIGWLLICRYRRAFKSKEVLIHESSRNSKTKTIADAPWSNYNKGGNMR